MRRYSLSSKRSMTKAKELQQSIRKDSYSWQTAIFISKPFSSMLDKNRQIPLPTPARCQSIKQLRMFFTTPSTQPTASVSPMQATSTAVSLTQLKEFLKTVSLPSKAVLQALLLPQVPQLFPTPFRHLLKQATTLLLRKLFMAEHLTFLNTLWRNSILKRPS